MLFIFKPRIQREQVPPRLGFGDFWFFFFVVVVVVVFVFVCLLLVEKRFIFPEYGRSTRKNAGNNSKK